MCTERIRTTEKKENLPIPIRCAGVLVVRINPETGMEEYLVAKRLKTPERGRLGIPGGKAEPKEHNRRTAVRELEEETGIKIKQNKLIGPLIEHRQHFIVLDKRYQFFGFVYQVEKGTEFNPKQTELKDHEPWMWLTEGDI